MFQRGYPTPDPTNPFVLPTPLRTGASAGYTGRGIVIAFIDSGFYPHPDLGNRVLAHVDATTSRIVEGRRYGRPMWYSWHGQMTSVVACGDGSISDGRYAGIASEANLVLVKVSTIHKQIKEPDILRGLQWVLENHNRFNIRIVNLSVGGDTPNNDAEYALYTIIRELASAGVTIVTAGGNSPSLPLVPPNCAPEAITIGGFDDHNSLNTADWTLYTNTFGLAFDGTPKPDVLAPANWIASPILPGTYVMREARWLAQLLNLPANDVAKLRTLLKLGIHDFRESFKVTREQLDQADLTNVLEAVQARILEHKIIDQYHQYVSGTSVAAAVASSIIAQMLEANPRLTPLNIKAILMQTAKRLPNAPLEQQGAGIIDASEAVAASVAFPSRAAAAIDFSNLVNTED